MGVSDKSTYGDEYPYLLQIGLERIDWGLFPTRAANRLRRDGCMIWRDIAKLTDAELLQMRQLGETTVGDIRDMLGCLEVARERFHGLAHAAEGATYGQDYPHIRDLGELPVEWRLFPIRPANGLRRTGVHTWADVADMTDSDVIGITNLGVTAVVQIRSTLNKVDAQQLLTDAASTGINEHQLYGHSEGDVLRLARSKLGDLTLLARWATAHGAETIHDMLDLLAEDHLPGEVAVAQRRVWNAPLASTNPGQTLYSDPLQPVLPDGLLDSVLAYHTFTQFVLTPDPPTFRQVGKDLGISGEAIRRRMLRDEALIRAFIKQSSEWAPLRWVIERRFSPEVWLIDNVDVDWLESHIALINADPLRQQRAVKLLLWMAGPYTKTIWSGLLTSDQQRCTEMRKALKKELRNFVQGPDRPWHVGTNLWFRHTAEHWQVPEAAFAVVLRQLRWQQLGDEWRPWPSSIAGRCRSVLLWADKPMTEEELAEYVPTRGQHLYDTLTTDRRFVRVDAQNHIGLAEQGHQHYKSIRDSINRHIEASGGDASQQEILELFPSKFKVSTDSVRRNLNGIGYDRDGDRIRLDDSPTFNARNLNDSPTHELWDKQWAQKQRVTPKTLQGFSFTVSRSLAWHNGIRPGDSLIVPLELDGRRRGTVSIIWHMQATTVMVGRARAALTKAGYASGDEIVATVSRKRCRIKRHLSGVEAEEAIED